MIVQTRTRGHGAASTAARDARLATARLCPPYDLKNWVPACAGTSGIERQFKRRSPSRLGDQIGLLVEQRHAELKQHGIEVPLTLADDAVELTLPFVLLGTYAKRDAIGYALARGFLQQRHHRKLAARLGRKISGDRAPQHAGIDFARLDVSDHALARRFITAVDHEWIRLGMADQTELGHDAGGRRAGDDTDTFAREARVREARDP